MNSDIPHPGTVNKPATVVYACSGCSDAGELADRIARELTRAGVAEMSCLAGIGGRVKSIMAKGEKAERILVIDGCPLNCARKTLELAGLKKFDRLGLHELGLRKGNCPVTEEHIAAGVAAAARLVARPAKKTPKLDALSREVVALKKQLNAVILAHNYQAPEIQDVADFVGDSLGLSQEAAKTKADVILFCGVHFMAETAKILNPDKIVILPDEGAGCSLEESCPADKLRALQATNPNFYTVAYINCSAEVKALSDVICTSGNAVKIVQAAPAGKDLLFVPDENLGAWVMEQTGRPMTLWRGNCYAHVEFQSESLLRVRRANPAAKVVVHPESLREVCALADAVCSTEKMIAYCRDNPARQFVVATESGIIHRLRKECPGKEFLCAPVFDAMRAPTDPCRCSECKFMKINTLEKVRDCMKRLAPWIELSAEILRRARRPIERMLEISAAPAARASGAPKISFTYQDLGKSSGVDNFAVS